MKTKIRQDIEDNLHALLNGRVLAIDPSAGSGASMPGWAVYEAGILKKSGILPLPSGRPLGIRLRELHEWVQNKTIFWDIDLMVYEEIPPQRYGNTGNATSHASLLKAVGVIMAAGSPYVIGILPVSWKSKVRPTYTKSDENDAVEIGYVVIEEARKIREEQRKKAEKEAARGKQKTAS